MTSTFNELAGNYLRVRGEYVAGWNLPAMMRELPPRARRIPNYSPDLALIGGTTSACAENTTEVSIEIAPWGNYLRVRGEYLKCILSLHAAKELPPRARRIPLTRDSALSILGTTSACAENTHSDGMNF